MLLKRDAVLCCLFTFMVIGLFGLITLNMSILSPFVRAFADFRYTDLYYSKLDKPGEKVCPHIVIVNIGNLDRSQIGQLLTNISRQKPRAIGVDVIFEGLKDKRGDSFLRQAVSGVPQAVFASKFSTFEPGMKVYGGYISSRAVIPVKHEGYVNVGSSDPYPSTVRYFVPSIDQSNVGFNSFSYQIYMASVNNFPGRIIVSPHENMIINYAYRNEEFVVLDGKKLLEENPDISLLDGNIVLLGYTGGNRGTKYDIEDKHFTPFNEAISGRGTPDMSGVMINANIINMLLNHDIIRETKPWFNWLLGLILTWLHIGLFLAIFIRHHKFYHLVSKSVQLLTSIILVLISYICYEQFKININITPCLLGVIFCADVIYFYEGILIWLNKRFGLQTVFLKS